MQSNLINNYIQTQNRYPQNNRAKNAEEIELISTRKVKPDFDIHKELANRTFLKPLPPKGHIIKDGILSAPAVFMNDVIYDLKALKAAKNGEANDHQLGKLNDLGMKLGGLAIAVYLSSIKKTPVKQGMEFVGFAAFFASMALWPKIALEIPAKIIHGFNPFMRYEDSQGRKKPFFQDNQYLPFDLITDKEINRIGNRNGIPKDLLNRRDAVQEKMRQVALQNNTMWMLTAGFATPVLSSLICNRLEPYVADLHSWYMNNKIDNILIKFPSAKKKYTPANIEKDVNSLIEMYKGSAVTPEIIDSFTTALTQELNPKVAMGVKDDLTKLLSDDKYVISNDQIKPLIKNVQNAFATVAEKDGVKQHLNMIVPTVEQLETIFNKYNGKSFTIRQLKDLTNDIKNALNDNLRQLKASGITINKNTEKRFMKVLAGKAETTGPLMSVLLRRPSKILDDNAQDLIRKISSAMVSFCAENNALSVYAYKKLASAPDTAKGKFWTDFVNSLIDILKFTPEEIANTRYDRPLVAKLLSTKMQKIAADKDEYTRVIKEAAIKFSKIKENVKPSNIKVDYIKQLNTTFNAAANEFKGLGLDKTVERLIGKNGRETGSLLSISKFFVNDNLSNVNNTFARFFNAMNLYRTLYNDPELKTANNIYKLDGSVGDYFKKSIKVEENGVMVEKLIPRPILKEVKEEIAALADFLAVSGRISDYSVKFEFLRNLLPNDKDFGNIEFNKDGTIKYKYYNEKWLSENGIFIPSDNDFFTRVMNLLYGGDIQKETKDAIKAGSGDDTIIAMLKDFRLNMMRKVGDLENFAYPSKIVHLLWEEGKPKYSGVSPNESSLCVGSAFDEMMANACRQSYNTRQWLKMFGGFGAGLLGFTVLSQFFFGRNGKAYKKNKV